MNHIRELHEEIYNLLLQKRDLNPRLNFTFRKSNHAARLENGYWFYGNDEYLAVSFWSGMDWKNRTPNIALIITRNRQCFLEINVADSEMKLAFVNEFLTDRLNLGNQGRRFVKEYTNYDLTENILNFLKTDKEIIDEVLRVESGDFFKYSPSNSSEIIQPISNNEFKKRHKKVLDYKEAQTNDDEEKFLYGSEKPSKIIDLKIRNFGLIESVEMNIEFVKNQWIFITGDNGSGKTNLLRAIATILGNRHLEKSELSNKPFESELTLFKNGRHDSYQRLDNYEMHRSRRPLIQGLAMYGPYRLDVSSKPMTLNNFKKALGKVDSFRSLFRSAEPLLGIDNQFSIWRSGTAIEKERFHKRAYFIKSVLTDVVPNLVDVHFSEAGNNSTEYVFTDPDTPGNYCVLWNGLSSGIKSMLALLGDILIRFYDQQRDIDDPSEFKGVVLIDEIDLHLHPQGQKDLVINLTKTFPGIQFIASTHSPIPLLGAPHYSEFFRVERSFKTVTVKSMDFIKDHIYNLLPNQLLTSQLFGLTEIRSAYANSSNVFTGTTMVDYEDYLSNKENYQMKDPDNQKFIDDLKHKWSEKR